MGDRASTNLEPGDIVEGRLRIERTLGTGGMGVVLLATDLKLRRPVALKLMNADASDATSRARFEREARAAAKLRSVHVAQVLETGMLPDGTPFYVMEYLEGRSLDAILEDEGPLPPALAIDHVLEAMEAIREAHAAGLVHRDLKPSNLFVAQTAAGGSMVKVLDFGVVKDTMGGTASLTRTGASMGTPAYMAPEQIRANDVIDARTDLWAIGATLYELVSGALPFEASSVPAMLQRVLRDEPTPLRKLRPDVPEALEAIIVRCLAKERSARFASVDELADALRAARASAAVSQVLPRGTMRISSGPHPIPRGDTPTLDAPEVAAPRPRHDRPAIPLPGQRRKAAQRDRRGLVLGMTFGAAGGVIATVVMAFVVGRAARTRPDAPMTATAVASSSATPSALAPEPPVSPPLVPSTSPAPRVRLASSATTTPNLARVKPTHIAMRGPLSPWANANAKALEACAKEQPCSPIWVHLAFADGAVEVTGGHMMMIDTTLVGRGKSSDYCDASPGLLECLRRVAASSPAPEGTVTIDFLR